VLGICNGFQILCEAGLLPGALLRNRDLKFRCEHVSIRVEQTDTRVHRSLRAGSDSSIPIAHGEGNFFCDEAELAELEKRAAGGLQVLCDEEWRADRPRPIQTAHSTTSPGSATLSAMSLG
jgi:phosphoribosylformylglycinamidine synthase